MNTAKILLVDDETSFLETISKRLQKREFSILTGSNGSEALKIMDGNQKPDVIILDVKMPGMDGIETLRKIKRKHPLVEVIMLTGHATV
jgi:CheY-like chemotaxis protein